jgi:glucosamine-6-phosphate deaminase
MSLAWIQATDYEAMSRQGAARIAAAVEQGLRLGRPVLLGLATGNTMLRLYEELARLLNQCKVNLSHLHTFNLDEYIGSDGQWVPADHALSYHAYMEQNLFRRFDPRLGFQREHVHFPDPANPAAFDALIQDMGGLDLQLLGIGFNGHIAFNEPQSESEISVDAFAALPTRVIDLTELTIDTNARLTTGGDRSQVPRRAITMGMKPILAAGEILLLACFAEQQLPLERIKQGRPTPEIPASYLIDHPRATIIYTGDKIRLEEGR